ncbi:MAG TPA: hypothetical protein VKG82_04605 [Solirubrobacteraceae bacterium]|nr:hypothetical protein [Solirubrobacteraceae bacterium]
MSTLVEPETHPSVEPEAGVIRDARIRAARRRRRLAGVVTALAALAALVVWLAARPDPSPSSTRAAKRLALERDRRDRQLRRPHISPILEGGGYGWCVMLSDGGSCATVPVQNARTLSGVRSIGSLAGTSSTRNEEQITALLAAPVEGVLANGRPASVLALARLPYGLRLAQIDLPRAPWAAPRPSLLATGAGGRPLAYIEPESGAIVSDVRWWERPEPLPSGPCQIRAHGLTALEPEWGHVAAAIRPYPAKIIGRAFASCIDIEYYLHNWPLETAILLDAQHPGAFPATIPGMRAIEGAGGLFAAPGDWHGEITAIRRGDAWVVVAGGSGVSQRMEVLAHLRTSVAL